MTENGSRGAGVEKQGKKEGNGNEVKRIGEGDMDDRRGIYSISGPNPSVVCHMSLLCISL